MNTVLSLAPMEGLTGWIFRQTLHRHFPGADRYFTPFLSPTSEHHFPRRTLDDILPEHNEGINLVPQLLTKSAEDFLWAAGELKAMGYREVNLNLGCPSGTVVAKGKGSGFLAHPEELMHFLDTVFSQVDIKVSVKTRLGLLSQEEFPRLLAIFDAYPLAELIIHPRIQRELYRGTPHKDWFSYAIAHTSLPLCYNGDLRTTEQCLALCTAFPSAGLMLGRGAAADPALFSKLKGGPAAAKQTLRAFHDELYEGYCSAFSSRRNAAQRMKELWSYLILLFRDHARYAKALKKASNYLAYEQQVTAIFRDLELLPEASSDGI